MTEEWLMKRLVLELRMGTTRRKPQTPEVIAELRTLQWEYYELHRTTKWDISFSNGPQPRWVAEQYETGES